LAAPPNRNRTGVGCGFDDLSIDDADLTQSEAFCEKEIDKFYDKAYDQPSIYNRCMADHGYQPAQK
jgi:hypothetical protein